MNARVLLVEDDQAMAGMLRSALEGAGFEVACADNGADGLELLRAGGFQAVITDISMPELNGDAMLAAAQAEMGRIPAVLIGGYAQNGLPAGLGAVTYISKPFQISEVIAALRGTLADAA